MADNWQNAFALGPCEVSVYDGIPSPGETPIVSGVMSMGDSLPFALWGSVGGAVTVDETGVVTLECDEPMVRAAVYVRPTYDAQGQSGRISALSADDVTFEGWAYPVIEAAVAPYLIDRDFEDREGTYLLYTNDADSHPFPPAGSLPPPADIDLSGLVDDPDGMSVYVGRGAPS